MNHTSSSIASPRIQRWSPLILTAVWAVGLWLTWGTWADPQIDFGRELYVPSRMAQGDVLYRDLAYFNGPLSPVVNSLICRICPSLKSLSLANALILLFAVLGSSHWLGRLLTPGAGVAAGLTFLLLFAFNQYLPVANYNWICPYSHEMTHGVVLAGLALSLICRFISTGSRAWMMASGFVAGLVMLTKCEIAIALLGAMFVGCALVCWRDWWQPDLRRRTIISIVCGWLLVPVPLLLAIALLCCWLPLPVAVESALGSWVHLSQSELRSSPFYRAVMGTTDLTNSLTLMYGWAMLYLAVLGVILIAARQAVSNSRPRAIAAGLMTGIILGGALLSSKIELESAARPWPVVLCLFAGLTLLMLRDAKHRNIPPEEFARMASLLVLHCFAGLLLLKILFFSRFTHYGFALGLPATLLIVATTWADWPAWVQVKNGSPLVARAGLVALGFVLVAGYMQVSASYLAEKTDTLGTGRNKLYVDERGDTLRKLLIEIDEHVGPNETLACLPEGALLNVWSDRRTSLKYLNFVPADLLMFGEKVMFADLQAHPPDWIALIDRDTSEYGLARFGQDYAQELSRWINAQYETISTIENATDGRVFGAELLRRRKGLPSMTSE